jgi:PAS domain S-box-containing protein
MQEPTATTAQLQEELAALRQRNAELEHQVNELRHDRDLMLALIENAPASFAVKDLDRRMLLVNKNMEQSVQMSRQDLLGSREDEWFHPAVMAAWIEHDREVIESRETRVREFAIPTPIGDIYLTVSKFPLFNASGEVYALGTIANNTTEQKRNESERLLLQQQVIDAQEAALREIGTPLVPIAAGVVAMPLIGAIDSARAQMIMETLLEGISTQQAHVAILDITGVKVVDTQVASALLRAAQAAQLLGARVMLTGIGADVAQSLVQLGADLHRIETRSTLQAGIAAALA